MVHMMTDPVYFTERLPDLPVLLSVIGKGWTEDRDLISAMLDMERLLNEAEQPLFLITELDGIQVTLDHIVIGANAAAQGERSLLHHPQVREVIVVTESPVIKHAAEGLRSDAFGNIPVRTYPSIKEAIDYVREQVGR